MHFTFQLPAIKSCYATALWIKLLSAGRSILPYGDWSGNILAFSWTKAKARSLTAFLTYCSPCSSRESNSFTQHWIFIHSCNQGSAVFLYWVHYTECSCSVIHHKPYVLLKPQFFAFLDCDLHLVSGYNLFFKCFNTLFSSILYLHHLWLVELIEKRLFSLIHLPSPPPQNLLKVHWIFRKHFMSCIIYSQ